MDKIVNGFLWKLPCLAYCHSDPNMDEKQKMDGWMFGCDTLSTSLETEKRDWSGHNEVSKTRNSIHVAAYLQTYAFPPQLWLMFTEEFKIHNTWNGWILTINDGMTIKYQWQTGVLQHSQNTLNTCLSNYLFSLFTDKTYSYKPRAYSQP